MLELEKTFLLKKVPSQLDRYPYKEIQDIYIPGKHKTAQIRFRKIDNEYNFTKKCPTSSNNRSIQEEKTISIDKEEFSYIASFISNKISKHRYHFPWQDLTLEVDVFQEGLSGLIMVDVEFPDEESKEKFQIPDFCLCEVTQDVIFTGGLLCGKKYKDITEEIEDLGYKKLFI